MDIIDLVLATDMGAHFDIVSSFGGFLAGKGMQAKMSRRDDGLLSSNGREPREAAIDFSNEPGNARILILKVAMKLSDLGHCFLPWEEHMSWSERLKAEFFSQGDAEREQSLAVSPLMDRYEPGVSDHRNSAGFFQMFVMPMAELWVDAFPACMPMLKQGRANLERHQSFYT